MVKTVTPKNKQLQLNRFGCYPLESISTHLEFSVTLKSNDLVPEQKYKSRQDVIYQLIKYLHEEKGMGYRKISYKLNEWGIKTERGKKWFNTSVFSVLKRRKQRDNRIRHQRKVDYPVEIGKFHIKYKLY